jgi:hypothetical protein
LAGKDLVWRQDPRLGGLFVLHVNGQAVADCAVTDRGQPREEQIRTLAEADWIPPQQLAALFEAINEEKQARPSMAVLAGDRRISPLRGGGFGATIDSDEEPSRNPVRSYLFPNIERSGTLALEPGEQFVMSWKSYEPHISAWKAEDDSLLSIASIPRALLRKWRGVLTNRRLVYHGRLEPPKATREDYPSVFLPSTVFEGIATYRQIKRWVTRPNLHWAFHIRHEWLSEFGVGNRPEKKRPLLLRRDDTMFICAGFRYPSGDRGVFQIPYKQADPVLPDVGEAYAQAVCDSQPQLAIADAVQSERQVSSESLFSSKQEREARTLWGVEGSLPWSLPPSFGEQLNQEASTRD